MRPTKTQISLRTRTVWLVVVVRMYQLCIISSPEHELLNVSYFDRSMSVVRSASWDVCHPSWGVNNLL